MTSSYQAISIANMVLFGFAMAGVLIVVWIDWLRTRQFGYLVLAAWALSTMAGMALSYFPALQLFVGKSVNHDSSVRMMMWINLLRTLISSGLLLVGLGLLVFGQQRETSPRAT